MIQAKVRSVFGAMLVDVEQRVDDLHRVCWRFFQLDTEFRLSERRPERRASKRHRKWESYDTWGRRRHDQDRPTIPEDVKTAVLEAVRSAVTIEE